jgi:hypothetical protein
MSDVIFLLSTFHYDVIDIC